MAKTNSNLFSDFDMGATEANKEVVKTSFKKSEVPKTANEQINKSNDSRIEIDRVNERLLAMTKLKQTTKSSYMTLYLKQEIQEKIKKLAKKHGVSNGAVIEMLLTENK